MKLPGQLSAEINSLGHLLRDDPLEDGQHKRDPDKPDRLKDDKLDAGKDDGLSIRPLDLDDLRGLPAMPARDGQIPGLPEKNLGLDM